MKQYTIILWALFMLLFMACSDDKNESEEPDNKLDAQVSNDDDGTPHPAGSYDYSKMAPHPRLFLSESEEAQLKEFINTNADFMAIHQAILHFSDSIINTEPVVYKKSGKRLLSVSRDALKRIFYLSYAYRMTDDPQYLARAERELKAVCAFKDWNPSHFLDVGEMSAGVAIGYDWLYDGLSAQTRQYIREALKKNAFEASKIEKDNWFLTNEGNWNQVCNGGLTMAALATYEANKHLSVEIIERALESIKLPLAKYAPDGNYEEGYMYWMYGTAYQIMFLSALDSALGSDKDLHKSEGFLKSAEYIMYMVGPTNLCFNYSDCYKTKTANPSIFWMAKKSNNMSLLYSEKSTIKDGGLYVKKFEEDRLLPLVMIYANGIDMNGLTPPDKKLWVGKGKTPVAMIRTNWTDPNARYVGIKAGEAETSHSHMDAGSFVYDADGVRWAMDLGMQSYEPLESKGMDIWNMGQKSERWSVFRLNNTSHNVLTINGNMQAVDGNAQIVETYDTDQKRGVKLDLTGTYKGSLDKAVRSVVLIDEDYLQIEDEIQSSERGGNMQWRMVTSAKASIEDNKTIRLEENGIVKHLVMDTSVGVEPQIWSTKPVNDYDEANPGTSIVGFQCKLPAGQTLKFTAKIQN